MNQIVPSGSKLIDSVTGKTVRLPGMIGFAWFKRCLRSGKFDQAAWLATVLPILQEYRKIAIEGGYSPTGLIVVRVFRHAASWNLFGITDPWSYEMAAARTFTEKCLAENFLIDWTGGDYQVCFPSSNPSRGQLDGPKGIHEHHNQFTSALVGLPNVIWNVTNEPLDNYNKNGLNPTDAPPPPWAPVLQYTGDYDDHRDTAKDLALVNLHPDRSNDGSVPKWVGKGHESAPYMWRFGKPVVYDEWMGADETDQPNKRSNNPAYFGITGSVLTMVSIAYFHFQAAFSGDGTGPDFAATWPVQRACAVEYWRGVVGALLVSA